MPKLGREVRRVDRQRPPARGVRSTATASLPGNPGLTPGAMANQAVTSTGSVEAAA